MCVCACVSLFDMHCFFAVRARFAPESAGPDVRERKMALWRFREKIVNEVLAKHAHFFRCVFT